MKVSLEAFTQQTKERYNHDHKEDKNTLKKLLGVTISTILGAPWVETLREIVQVNLWLGSLKLNPNNIVELE